MDDLGPWGHPHIQATRAPPCAVPYLSAGNFVRSLCCFNVDLAGGTVGGCTMRSPPLLLEPGVFPLGPVKPSTGSVSPPSLHTSVALS